MFHSAARISTLLVTVCPRYVYDVFARTRDRLYCAEAQEELAVLKHCTVAHTSQIVCTLGGDHIYIYICINRQQINLNLL